MPEPKEPRRTEAEEIEIEYKRLQVQLMRDQVQRLQSQQIYNKQKVEKMIADMQAAERDLKHRQSVCHHRKGGKNNRFAQGNDNNYSIVQNTYPTGEVSIMCSRCFLTVWKPDRKLKQTDPKLYAQQQSVWKEWSSWPTDNTPSGSKMFEVQPA